MMSKTHITIGTSCALIAVSANPNPANACLALAGGALGGIMSDVDVIDNDKTGDAIQGEIISVIIIILTFILDKVFKLNAFNQIEINPSMLIFGIFLFIVLYILGIKKDHRGFTHSLIALIIYSIPIVAIYEPIASCFMIGFLSHLVIDLFNKKGIQLLFPLKHRFCLKLCYANGIGNKVLMILGLIVTIILTINCFVFHIALYS